MRTYPLKQIVSGPTRNLATLDKIFTNTPTWFQSPTILPAITKSDHNSVLLVPSENPQRPTQQRIQTYRRISNPNPLVDKTWYWNAKIYALLKTGKKILIKPYLPIKNCDEV